MAKKDNLNRGSNVETYRKRIGKQEYQRNKVAVKSVKDAADAKQSAIGIQEVLLVLLAIFVLLASIYLMFFLSFTKE
uniref:Triple QxxK/R motif-containing protein n=1 Tax=Ciona intestinalis TaxID=7719 RepID=H2XVM2_CIOIN|nr:triple QxxK/R motif-containing protein [Ciona intestinalis]|eukprot:XP_002126386.1 triple QxxK/R motif-containing protein [Ciona intestinalis]